MLKKSHLLNFAMSAALASVPACAFAAVLQDRQDHNDQQERETAAHQNYHFRTRDRSDLQEHYRASHPHPQNNGRHWQWHRGVNLPSDWHGRVEPLPQADIALLAPPPPGYLFGYYDGWAIVYDPNTGVILDAVFVG